MRRLHKIDIHGLLSDCFLSRGSHRFILGWLLINGAHFDDSSFCSWYNFFSFASEAVSIADFVRGEERCYDIPWTKKVFCLGGMIYVRLVDGISKVEVLSVL